MDVKTQFEFPVDISRAMWASTNPRRGSAPKNLVEATVSR